MRNRDRGTIGVQLAKNQRKSKENGPCQRTVYALQADGTRRRVVPSAVEKGRLSFEAKVDADPTAASYLYELVRNAR